MKIFYNVNARTVRDEEGKPHAMYGIDAVRENGIVQDSFVDVFDNYKDAEELAQKCTELELDPIHLQDVIEDAVV